MQAISRFAQAIARSAQAIGRSWRGRVLLAAFAGTGFVSAAHATPMEYTITGTASGTLGATTSFTGATFAIRGVADTSAIVSIGGGSPPTYCVHLTSVTFSLPGLAAGAIVDPLDIVSNTLVGAAGIVNGPACPGGGDWLDTNVQPAFLSWHLDTPLGPIAFTPSTDHPAPLRTTRGLLTLSGLTGLSLTAAAGAAAPEARAGLIDPTFGFGGRAIYPAPPEQSFYAYVTAMVVRPDASIDFVGYPNSEGGSVRRLTPAGTIDSTFGVNGRVDALVAEPFAAALQPDGKLVVAGTDGHAFAVSRLLPSGAPDPTFGNGLGIVTSPFGLVAAFAEKVLLQPDGRIVAVGFTNSGGSTSLNTLVVARYLSNGMPDTSFGGGGAQIHAEASGSTFEYIDAALQSDGKIVVGAFRLSPAGPILLRFTADGAPDFSLSTSALGSLGFEALTTVHVQPDGKLIVTGMSLTANLVARLNSNGTPDSTFGVGGVATIVIPGTTTRIDRSALQPDGKMVLILGDWSGRAVLVPRVARLNANGTIDTTFGTAGIAPIESADPFGANSVALQPDGKILVGGELITGSGASRLAHQMLLRFQGDPITGTIVEFFNAPLNHYFITASAVEQASIDAGGSGPGWVRTGQTFKSGGVSRACRFYGTPGVGPNSHFYTLDPAECAQVQMDPGWHFESYDFSATPADPIGGCASGTVPVFRAYNHRFAQNDSNHRYATSPFVYIAQVESSGWTGEGVVFCAPQ